MLEFTEERVFPAKLEMIPDITAFIYDFGEKAHVDPKKMMHLELAVDEVVTNICNYANVPSTGGILVRLDSAGGQFKVSFVDEGIPFDPLVLEEPDVNSGLEDREIGGLGIFLVKRVTDEVRYKRDGNKNILTLILNL